MKVAIDALYNDQACTARVAAVVFENWSDSVARETYTMSLSRMFPANSIGENFRAWWRFSRWSRAWPPN